MHVHVRGGVEGRLLGAWCHRARPHVGDRPRESAASAGEPLTGTDTRYHGMVLVRTEY